MVGQIVAIAGNGGNAPDLPKPNLQNPAVSGGSGGAGGTAAASCTKLPATSNATCDAIAIAGQGGHGASGQNHVTNGGKGGDGGTAGGSYALSCCQECLPGLLQGNAESVAGTGGSGGHGGNSASGLGGLGGNGGGGGLAQAVTTATFKCPPPQVNSYARGVNGSGGNGGNGGNGGSGGGTGGNGGSVFTLVGLQNDCSSGPGATVGVLGNPGVAGVNGN